MAQLEHPNLLPVYSGGRTANVPFIVMKYLDGQTLGDCLQEAGRL